VDFARLLLDGPAPGPWNMGVDEALLASAAGQGGVSLRLYAWSGPWLSLGYAQRVGPGRLRACAQAGVGLVRRATGGGAVLHGADLTYALAAPCERVPGDLESSYGLLVEALLAALRGLGVPARRPGAREASPVGFDCFAAPVRADLCAGGRKLAGSAQRRVRGALLQHGSLRLGPDPPAASAAAGLDPGRATSLSELGCALSRDALAEALPRQLGAALGLCFEPGHLAPEERRRAWQRCAEHRRDPLCVAPQGRLPASRALADGR
jgi:lipoate-protein ligase A